MTIVIDIEIDVKETSPVGRIWGEISDDTTLKIENRGINI